MRVAQGALATTLDLQIPLHYESPNAVTLHIPIPLNLRKPLTSNPESPLLSSNTATSTPPPPPKPIPIPQSTATALSKGVKLTIKLPPSKENRKPETTKSDTTACEVDTDSKCTFCPVEHRQPIIKMLENCYCAYPLIPGYSSLTLEGIREWAVKQMYNYCVDHDLREVWAYLWENWYRPG
ncbi:hypothetical protein PILCRDRAFT_77964 [Piloderma croceum F 1598]|uniref:Uncharacterized protein n=1 Tax=Piloderma croceum (strain F 1598) TaxID=765440 RepID=A0A0C3EUT7_PILCF|nr:hypothetical protein PILCRDRAFT_77964 [Piloderma croceum F 1598]